MKITDKIITSTIEPQQKNVLWHNPETGELKIFGNKGWEVVGGNPGEGNDSTNAVIPITYTELVKLRDSKQLIPGQYYKIIDYCTSVDSILAGYKSANHQFDIVVHAIDNNLLAHQAYAARHEGDTYFENSDLNKWVLHYTLDNVNWSSTGKTVLELDGWNLILESDLQVISEIKQQIIQSVYDMYNEDGYFYINDERCTTPEDFLTFLFNTYKYIAFDEYYEYVYLLDDISINNTVNIYVYGMEGYFYTLENSLFNVIQSQPGTGCITYMEDEHHNIAYYDFKNILMARYTEFELDADIDTSLMKNTNPLEVLTYHGCHESSQLININYESIQWHYTLTNVLNDATCDGTINRQLSNRFVITDNYGNSLPNIVIFTVSWTPTTYFIDTSRDLTLSSHMNGTMSGNGSCFITNSFDIIESLSYSGGNNYTGCQRLLNLRQTDCNFSGVNLFIGACSMHRTQLNSVYNVILVTDSSERVYYSLVAGLSNLDIQQSSIFGTTTSPKIIMQNNTNDGIKIIDFSTL